jgi:choline kinase
MPNFIHKISNKKVVNCIFLSAGRNKIRGQRSAKCLLEIDGKKLIDSQVEVINKSFKNVELFYAVGDKSGVVINHILDNHPQVRIVENQKYKETTPLESLRLCLNCSVCSDTYIIYGDKSFDKSAISFSDVDSPTIVESVKNVQKNSDLGLVYQNDILKSISYGVPNIWGQIFYIPSSFFVDFRKKINNLSKRYYNVFDLINLVAKDYKFKIHKSKNIKEV